MQNTAESVVRKLAKYINEINISSNLDEIVGKIFHSANDSRAAALKQSIQYYLNGTKDGFLKYRSVSSGIFLGGLSYLHYFSVPSSASTGTRKSPSWSAIPTIKENYTSSGAKNRILCTVPIAQGWHLCRCRRSKIPIWKNPGAKMLEENSKGRYRHVMVHSQNLECVFPNGHVSNVIFTKWDKSRKMYSENQLSIGHFPNNIFRFFFSFFHNLFLVFSQFFPFLPDYIVEEW